jgi:glucose 1-dehydrogenase
MKLAGQVALVTGASAGIGRATALALAQEGADVAVNYLTYPEQAEALAEQVRGLGRRVLLCPVDVADQEAVEAMVARVAAELGRLDVFVSAAVYSDREPITTANMAGFRRTIDVTMWGAFHGLRASANQMIRQGGGGCCVLVSSPHAYVPHATCAAYNMAKAALDQLGKTAALELAAHGIRVNLVHPGWTDTEGERKFFTEDAIRRGAARLPLGRLARPDEIARGIVFLADPASAYVTGSVLTLDGGANLPWWSRRGSGEF